MIVISGLLHTTSLAFDKESFNNSKETENENQQDFVNLEEKQSYDNLLTAENDTHYRNLSLLDSWDFPSYTDINDLAVVGNITYLATNRGLVIYNMSDPAHPVLLSQISSIQYCHKVIVEDDIVYLRSGYGYSFSIVDCSVLSNPVLLNGIPLSYTQDFTLEDGIAYFTTTGSLYGIQIYNFSDPLNPYIISYYEDLAEKIYRRIEKQDDYLFCLTEDDILVVFDVSDLLNPAPIAARALNEPFYDLIVKSNYLYLLSYQIIEIWDISNVYMLNKRDSISAFGSASFSIQNGLAYVVNDVDAELVIYNVSNPDSITLLASYDNLLPIGNLYFSRIQVDGMIATICLELFGFILLNISDYSNVTKIIHEFSGHINGIHLVGDYAILKYNSQGFKILNITDILNPVVVSYIFIENLYGEPYYENDLIYCFTSPTEEFLIINITNWESPGIIARLGTKYGIDRIIVENGLAFLERFTEYLILNVSDPTNPTFLFDSNTYVYIRETAVYNEFFIVASGTSGDYSFEIINVTNPLSPETISKINLTESPSKIIVNGSFLFIQNIYPTEFYIYDLGNITNPVLVSYITIDDRIYHFTIKDNLLCFLTRDEEFQLWELDASYNIDLYGQFTSTQFEYYDMTNVPIIKDDLIFMPLISSVYVVGFDSDNDAVADYLETNVYGTDPFDSDSDNDLILDGYEIDFNLDPLNGTDADLDYDGDTLTNYNESLILTDPWLNDTDSDLLRDDLEVFYGTDPLDPDTDFDNLTDFEEIFNYSTDPNDYDSDNDDLADGAEILTYFTDPLDNDTDDDFITDGFEILFGLNPHFDDASFDLDLDGLTNLEEFLLGTYPNRSDSDGDGYSDFEEIEAGTDPLDSFDFPDYPNHPIPTVQASWFNYYVISVFVFSISVLWFRKRNSSKKEVKAK